MVTKTKKYYEKLTEVSAGDIINAWTDEQGVMYSADRKRLLKVTANISGEYTVLPGTEVICKQSIKGISKIILPDGLKAIGFRALGGIEEPMTLPSSVEYIGDRSLSPYKHFIFPKSLKEISGEGVPEAEEYSSDSPNIQISKDFIILNNKLIRYMGKGGHVIIPDGVTEIGEYSFSYCGVNENIQSVVIPNSVTLIGSHAFRGRENLQSISIPDSVEIIEERAFWMCSSLQNISIPDTVEEIFGGAFLDCSSLQQVKLPNSLSCISKDLFGGCTSLQKIVIPDSVTEIEDYAFYVSGLTEIEIPESVTYIGDHAFESCKALQTIYVYGNPKVGKQAFSGCPGKRVKMKRAK